MRILTCPDETEEGCQGGVRTAEAPRCSPMWCYPVSSQITHVVNNFGFKTNRLGKVTYQDLCDPTASDSFRFADNAEAILG